ncbi:conserved hypothetical protein [Pseudomonas sp. OF001]|jgi:hypothetical protein|uniref:hypothetical protein n=1 Tax=Pseudomonas sp. OF001 TaxID=2772300 RepID=UPI00191B1314|nr:hypothetical protein [Pseudomonas sp. OF001]CAD5376763.1 conserved hypothetical protein [Pseudomonas sp. OF001]
MTAIPEGATHTLEGAYYRKARGGAYYWCRDGRNWRYMEDKQARFVLKRAQALENKA